MGLWPSLVTSVGFFGRSCFLGARLSSWGHFCIEVGYSCLVKVGESALKFQLVVVWVKSGLWALLLGGQDSCDRKVRK